MSGPFDYVNNLLYNKKQNMMRGTENDALAEKGYIPWQTNLALALHPDTILLANLMNENHHLNNRAQYEFYKYSIRPNKRKRVPWVKSVDDEVLDLICETYECNRNVARDYLPLLSKEQLQTMKEQKQKGG